MTEEQAQTQYKKLEQISLYAKSLGIIIDNIKCRFLINNQEHSVNTPIFGNRLINFHNI